MKVNLLRKGSRPGLVIMTRPLAPYVTESGSLAALFEEDGSEMPAEDVWRLYKNELPVDKRDEFRDRLALLAGHQINPLR